MNLGPFLKIKLCEKHQNWSFPQKLPFSTIFLRLEICQFEKSNLDLHIHEIKSNSFHFEMLSSF